MRVVSLNFVVRLATNQVYDIVCQAHMSTKEVRPGTMRAPQSSQGGGCDEEQRIELFFFILASSSPAVHNSNNKEHTRTIMTRIMIAAYHATNNINLCAHHVNISLGRPPCWTHTTLVSKTNKRRHRKRELQFDCCK